MTKLLINAEQYCLSFCVLKVDRILSASISSMRFANDEMRQCLRQWSVATASCILTACTVGRIGVYGTASWPGLSGPFVNGALKGIFSTLCRNGRNDLAT